MNKLIYNITSSGMARPGNSKTTPCCSLTLPCRSAILLLLLLSLDHGATKTPTTPAVGGAPDGGRWLPGQAIFTARRSHASFHMRFGLRGGKGEDDSAADRTDFPLRAEGGDDEDSGEKETNAETKLQDGTAAHSENTVFGMSKGTVGMTGGGWAMDSIRQICWYFLDVLVIEAQRLRFVGHLLAAAGIVRQEQIPQRLKRRRGKWWRPDDAAPEVLKPSVSPTARLKSEVKRDAAEVAGSQREQDEGDDGVKLVDFLRRGIGGIVGWDSGKAEIGFAKELKMLKRQEEQEKRVEEEQFDEEEQEESRPLVLQQWPPPDEYFPRVGDCPRVVAKNKSPGALAMGLQPYNDPYEADTETFDQVVERFALQQRDPSMLGRRIADPDLALEKMFSPEALRNSLEEFATLDASTTSSLVRLKSFQKSVVALKDKVSNGAIASAAEFEEAWHALEKRAALYNHEENVAEKQLAESMEKLANFDLDPAKQKQVALDDSFGRLSKEELDAWMISRGFEKISSQTAVDFARKSDEPHVDVSSANDVHYRLRDRHSDQDKDWSPYLPDEFYSAETKAFWNPHGFTSPKQLSGMWVGMCLGLGIGVGADMGIECGCGCLCLCACV